MYFLHLSKNESVQKREVIGVFDMDTATMSHSTRECLKELEKNMRTVNLSDDIPKSFVLSDNEYAETAYITGLSAETLKKRFNDIKQGE